jgi:hypothetical protein
MAKERLPSAMHVAERVAAAAICGVWLLNSAVANPPLGREKSVLSAVDSARSLSTPGMHPESASTAHLDLRPPANYPPAIPPADTRELAAAPSPSPIRGLYLDKNESVLSPALSIDETNFRVMSKPAIFVDRVRREGLPLARLWESRSALLSLGLSPKGKPGLWLTQKIR